ASGAFALWRLDVLEEVGGFSRDFSCEDIEITFRVHEHMRRTRRDYSIVALPDKVAVTEGPGRVSSLVAQRARWQRVTLETVWHYRRMLFNPRYGSVGLFGTPVILVSEVLAPFFQLAGIGAATGAVCAGVFGWQPFLLYCVLISFANAALTSAAVWLEDSAFRSAGHRHLARCLALG